MTDYVRNEKVSHLRQGDYIILKGAPCRIVELHKSKTGKHGAIKVRIIGLDVFTQRKYEDWFPGSETVEVPEVKKYDLRIIDIIDNKIVGKTRTGEVKTVPFPTSPNMQDLVEEIKQKWADGELMMATIACCVGKEGLVRIKGVTYAE